MLNHHSIGFRIAFWSGAAMVALGSVTAGYAISRMQQMVVTQRESALEDARKLTLTLAEREASTIKAILEEPLNSVRALSQALESAVRPDYERMTDEDWGRLRKHSLHLKVVADLAESLVAPYLAAEQSGALTRKRAQEEALKLLATLRYDQGNYLWVQDRTQPIPRMLMHPIRPELNGQIVDDPQFNTAMGRGENLLAALAREVADDGEGYVHYLFAPPGSSTPRPKLSYGRLIPDWDWVIGTGLYLDKMSFYSRDDINYMLKSLLSENQEFLGIYTGWEPNAFDGRDADFANTPGTDASGRFIPHWTRSTDGTLALEPLVDYEQPGAGNYYQLPKRTGREVILDPFRYPVQGQEVLMTSLVAPIMREGVFRGIVGIDLRVDDLQDVLKSTVKAFGDTTTQISLIAHRGTLAASTAYPQHLGQQIGTFHAKADQFIQAIARGESLQLTSSRDGAETLETLVPIQIGYTGTPWGVLVERPMSQVLELAEAEAAGVRQAIAVMLGVTLIAVLVAVAGMLWLARALVRRVRLATDTMRDIADGEGDLTRTLPETGGDELAELAHAFNRFQRRVRDLVAEAITASQRVAAAAEQLSATSREANTQIQLQQSESDQVATAMNEMTATVADVAKNAAGAAEAARLADQDTQQGQAVVNEAFQLIQSTADQVQSTAAAVAHLSQEAQNIGQVLDVIRGIADQTNLLALNAAIEAARAGEQGRGFAVVAGEVRTLASRTQDSTTEIQRMIERLQQGTRQAVTAMDQARALIERNQAVAEQAGQGLTSIAAAVARIRDMNTQIASATEEQSAVAMEVDRNLVNSARAIEQIATAARQIDHAAAELSQLATDQLNRLQRFKV
ncbi:MAG: methyl-accepting chemotaxis protein [Thermochromatium sp.]